MAETNDYAGLGRRFVAQVLDLVVLFAIAMLLAMLTGNTTATGFNLQGGPALLWFVIGAAYFVLLEGWAGQTVGKRLTGIVVRTEGAAAISMRDSLIRNVLRVIDSIVFYAIGIVLILLSDREQRLGDRVADTVVVRAG